MQVDEPEQVVCEETSNVQNTPSLPLAKYNPRPIFCSPIIISQEALNMFTIRVIDDRTTQYAHHTLSKYTPDSTAKPIDI